jgi:polysaccharide pyruvyl transferase CsaB
MSDNRAPGIVISGYYGFGNAGDEAILSAMIASLRHFVPGAAIHVISNNPLRTIREHGVHSMHRSDFWKILSRLRRASLFISGGGGLIQDVTSISSLGYYLGMIFLARLLGRKAVILAQGIGPLKTAPGRALTRLIANGLTSITVRDQESRRLLREIGVSRPPIYVTADPVLAMEPAPPEKINEIIRAERIAPEDKKIAICARPWATARDFPLALARAADHFCENEKARPVLIPFQRSRDLQICREIARLMKHHPTLVEGEYSAPELLGLLGRMDFLIGMRLHSLVFAALGGVPMVGIVYDPKVKSFLERIKAPSLPLEELTEDALIREVKALEGRRESFLEDLDMKVEILRENSLDNFRIVREVLDGTPHEPPPEKTEEPAENVEKRGAVVI